MLPSSSLGRNSLPRNGSPASATSEHRDRAAGDRLPVAAPPREQATVAVLQRVHPAALALGHVAADRVGEQRRHERHRQDHGPEQRERQRVRDRREDLSLDPLEGEDRQEGEDDDGLREQDRVAELDHGVLERGEPPAVGPVCRVGVVGGDREPDHERLDQHHRAVDDDPEVHRAERDQVCRQPAPVDHDERDEERQRDDRGDDQRRAPVAQEDHEDRDHQRGAEREVLRHRLHGVVDEVGALVDRDDLHARRQPRFQSRQALVQRLDHELRVLALDHLHDALDDVVALVETDDPGARARARLHRGRDVADEDRAALAARDGDALDVLDRAEEPDPAHDERLLAPAQEPAAGVAARVAERLRHLVDRHRVLLQQVRVEPDLVLLQCPAEADHVGDAGHHAQVRADDPVLDRAHLVARHVGRRLERIPVDLAERVRERRELRLHAGREVDDLQLLEHLLPREVVVGPFGEGERHHREPGDRHRAQLHEPRHARHLALDRQRDQALHLLRRLARILGDHLDLDVLHVRERLDPQVERRAHAEARERGDEHQHEHALRQAERDDSIEHRRDGSAYRAKAWSRRAPR